MTRLVADCLPKGLPQTGVTTLTYLSDVAVLEAQDIQASAFLCRELTTSSLEPLTLIN